MDDDLRSRLIAIAKEKISCDDVSHDFYHASRVLYNAEKIAKAEDADFDIIVPAALLHDAIVYPKNHPDRNKSQLESANLASHILTNIYDFPKYKIGKIETCILECSFSQGIVPELLESKILQDADGLEATGAISIMRTYASAGIMKKMFYDPIDPFCQNRESDAVRYALDLFYKRLLKVADRMHTKTARKIAVQRTIFLNEFLKELKSELDGK
jgi:uncharacterized protein